MRQTCYDDFFDPYFVKQSINNILKQLEGYKFFMIKRNGNQFKIIVGLDAIANTMNKLIDINYHEKWLDREINKVFTFKGYRLVNFKMEYEIRYI